MISREIYNGKGFVPFGIDTFIKMGGSLFENIDNVKELLNNIVKLSEKESIVVFPGGGPLDNLVEKIADENNLNITDVCPACLRAVDQIGFIICALNSNFIPVEDLGELRKAVGKGKIPVIIPSRMCFILDVFTRTNDITSDTIGAYFSFLVGADKYIILTNTDGIYANFNQPQQALIENISTCQLNKMGHTSVDLSLASFITAVKMNVWVGNGNYPDRLIDYITKGEAHGTKIVSL